MKKAFSLIYVVTFIGSFVVYATNMDVNHPGNQTLGLIAGVVLFLMIILSLLVGAFVVLRTIW